MNTQSRVSVQDLIELPMAPHEVWARLNNPAILQHCIKGCDQVVKTEQGEFLAQFGFRIGPFRKTLDARLVVDEISPPEEYRLVSRVQVGSLGSAAGEARVWLAEVGDDCQLRYQADIEVEGWFTHLSDHMLQSAADRYMKLFFHRMIEYSG